jgi:hypothetical protein
MSNRKNERIKLKDIIINLLIQQEAENITKKNKEDIEKVTKSVEGDIKKVKENKNDSIERVIEHKSKKKHKKYQKFSYEIALQKQLDYVALFSYLSDFKANTTIYNVYSANTLPYIREFADRDVKYEDIKKILRTSAYSTMLGIKNQQFQHDPVMYEQYKLWKLLDPAFDAILYELAKMG